MIIWGLQAFSVQDRHGVDTNTYPPMDTIQDVELLDGLEVDGWTIIKFRRLLVTCDSQDMDITVRIFVVSILAYAWNLDIFCGGVSDWFFFLGIEKFFTFWEIVCNCTFLMFVFCNDSALMKRHNFAFYVSLQFILGVSTGLTARVEKEHVKTSLSGGIN